MKLAIAAEKLKLKLENNVTIENRIIQWGYVSDLLSDVIANAEANYAWITVQKHPNIIAVASLKEISVIILAHGAVPEPETLNKAETNDIPVFTSPKTSFEIAGELYTLLTKE